jgi:hypothetical protein
MGIDCTIRDRDGQITLNLSLKQAVKRKCLDCSNWQPGEVRECPAALCPLWNFRKGATGRVKRELTDEQRAAAAERLKKAREGRNGVTD